MMSHFWQDDSGIASVEYALMLAFVALGIALGTAEVAEAVHDTMENVGECIADGNNCS
jgi:Flp pilus assembly pilin Flp